MKLGIISGTSIAKSQVFENWDLETVSTDFGEVQLKRKGELVAMNRHGFDAVLPPHSINYRANVAAMCELGIQSVVTLSSVGSVDPDLPPGSLVSVSDYMSFSPRTFIDDRMSAFAPVIENPHLVGIASKTRLEILLDKVYMQTRGPRFETRAEVRAIRTLGGDVVGMTFGNEADLLLERGIEISAFCMVDNFAHGVSPDVLSLEAFQNLVSKNQETIDLFLADVVDYLETAN